MSDDFKDFLNRDNLSVEAGCIADKKHNFCFTHDTMEDMDEYDENKLIDLVQEKYKRRIERFYQSVVAPTCFIRAICKESEIEWIKSNEAYITKTIKKYNNNNEIIYLMPKGMSEDIGHIHPYITAPYDSSSQDALRALFDSSQTLQDFIKQNYPGEKRLSNIIWDLERENSILKEENAFLHGEHDFLCSCKIRYELLCSMMKIKDRGGVDADRFIGGPVVLWGAGRIGQYFNDYIIKSDLFVDLYSSEEEYRGRVICHDLADSRIGELYQRRGKLNLIITPVYDKERIIKQLTEAGHDKTGALKAEEYEIIYLDDLLNRILSDASASHGEIT